MTCPSLISLSAANASEVYRRHFAECQRCRAITAAISGQQEDRAWSEPSVRASAGSPVPPAKGAVWTIWAPRSEEYLVAVVLENGEEDLFVIPLLADVRWAAESDLALSQAVLGYPALAPIWAAEHVLLEQAVEPVGMLSEQELGRLGGAYVAFYAGEPLEEPAGPPVSAETDPRAAALAARAQGLRPFFEPWAHTQVAEELGPVMGHRREELGLELAALASELDVDERVWAAFEAGRADPYATIPAPAAARAIRALELVASRRLINLGEASVEEHHRVEGPGEGAALARRRRGIAPRTRRDPEQARAAAREYGAHLARELGL